MLPCMEALLKGETWPHGQGENIPAGWKMDPDWTPKLSRCISCLKMRIFQPCEFTRGYTTWRFQTFFILIPTWGNDPIWRAYFSNGLVQPPTRYRLLGGPTGGRPSVLAVRPETAFCCLSDAKPRAIHEPKSDTATEQEDFLDGVGNAQN